MALKSTILLFFALTLFNEPVSAARPVATIEPKPARPEQLLDITSRTGAGSPECWAALVELKSCSGEIIMFFLNGETDIGPDCCRAIEIITRQCWPAMLTSLGFTPEEGDILRGYCDSSSIALPPLDGLYALSPIGNGY